MSIYENQSSKMILFFRCQVFFHQCLLQIECENEFKDTNEKTCS